MISEGDYFFKGAARISWGFATPNYLGAFLAGALPLVWALEAFFKRPQPLAQPQVNSRKRQKTPPASVAPPRWLWSGVGLLGLELFLWGALGATASRGAAVAAMSGVMLWAWFRCYHEGQSWRQSLGWVGMRGILCIIGFAVFSFGGRIAPGYLAQDASIGNRWLLWAGGAELCYSSPWRGWGTGESGHLFTQWIQPLDRPQEYKTMVNSYLHLAVEQGLPSLAGVMAVIAGVVGWPFLTGRNALPGKWASVCRAAACVWMTWAVANVFSTLFDEWRLWYIPGLAALLVVVSIPVVYRAQHGAARWIVGIAAVALGAPVAIFLCGAYYQWRASVKIERTATGMVVARRSAGGPVRWGVMPDLDVLGGKYGHEIRRWGLTGNDPAWNAMVFDPRRGELSENGSGLPERWVVFGANASRIDSLRNTDYVLIVHPRGLPPRHWAGKGMVLLNKIDEDGSGAGWVDWAESHGLRYYLIPDIGLDARAAWPEAYLLRLEGGRS